MASRLLTAFALGMVAGLLIAPDKGSETRKKIAQKGQDLKHKFNDFVDTLHDQFDSSKEDVKDMGTGARPKTSLSGEPIWNG